MKTKIIIYRDKKKEWRWRMTRKGRIVAESGEGYKRRGTMVKSLESLMCDIMDAVHSPMFNIGDAIFKGSQRGFKP